MRTFLGPMMLSFSIQLILAVTVAYAQSLHLTVVTEEWPPYNYQDRDEVSGVVTDVVKATLARASIDYSLQLLPWARAYHMAQTEKNVLIYTIFKLEDRVDKFQWVKIDGLATEMFIYGPGGRHDIMISNLDDAKQYRIGVTRETSTHHFLLSKGFIEDMNLFPVASERQNILQADSDVRRIDLTTGDRISLASWLKRAGYPADYLKEILFLFKQDFYMAFSLQTDPAIVNRIEKAYQGLRNDGTLDWILKKHYDEYGLEYSSDNFE